MNRKAACCITALILTVLLTMAVPGCSSAPGTYRGEFSRMLDSPLPPELEDRILDLDPDHITELEVRKVLSRGPAPRIINLNGSVTLVTMDSFSRFLIAMGYPDRSIRKPAGSGLSYSSYINSKKLAGYIAWYYEKDGMMPILIGHSQGGMKVIQVLHELAGAFNARLPVLNPVTGEMEARYTITDPLSGTERDVVGLRLGYASAITTGRLMRVLLLQWNMLKRLRQIPDTVKEFSGFSIVRDIIGSDLPGSGQYYPLGSSTVRNVRLPSRYSHMTVIQTEHLAQYDSTRHWINTYVPSSEEPGLNEKFRVKSDNILFAAEIWYNIKKYWCTELQELIRAQRRMSNRTIP
jgi:hypothetical protein